MKRILEIGNRYAEQSDWKDFALTKFCLCAMGIVFKILKYLNQRNGGE